MKLDLTSNNREIKTEILKIHGNCMEFNDIVIQLSNISLISTEDIAPAKFPMGALGLVFLGLVMLFLKLTPIILLGLAFSAVGGFLIYKWYSESEKTKELKKLLLATNSGNVFTIVFEDQPFLEKVLQVLKEIISNPGHMSDITINVKENTFTGDASVVHDFQEVHF